MTRRVGSATQHSRREVLLVFHVCEPLITDRTCPGFVPREYKSGVRVNVTITAVEAEEGIVLCIITE